MAKLLVVIGALEDEDHVKHVIQSISTGIDHWLRPLPLHTQEEIQSIINSLPSMKSIPNRNAENGSVVSRFKGRILDTTVLINPTLESLQYEFVDLLRTASSDCLVVYGGFVSEREADWVLQDGLFAFDHLLHILSDSKVVSTTSEKKIKVAISCHKTGRWRNIAMSDINENVHLEIIDSSIRDQGEKGKHAKSTAEESNLDNFTSFLEDNITNGIDTIFNTLKPPRREGFIKTRKPCLYIFPGGCGDSAYFAINGFNMLVDGGSTSKPCFWKLVQHIDKIDSILATHLGADNLPGINSFLMRKLQEQQIKLPVDSTSEEYQALRRCLVSPQLGPMFINAPKEYVKTLPKSSPRKGITKVDHDILDARIGYHDELIFNVPDVIKDTMRLSKALNLEMIPLTRKAGVVEPITLFSKLGCGRLDMYVLNPVEGCKELAFMDEEWAVSGHCKIPVAGNAVFNEAGRDEMASYTDLSSISVLLVWHPSDPDEKIVRVLFPGTTCQTRLFDGLDGISELPFMKAQHATANSVHVMKEVPKGSGTSSSQKMARSSAKSTGVGQKKFAPSIGKKAAGSTSSLTKDNVSSHSKISDKRTKNDKPTTTKSKTAISATGKTAATKDKSGVAKGTKGIGSQASTKPSSVSSLPKRPQTAQSSKSDVKRPANKTTAAKSKPTEKTTERPKKPTTVVQRAKSDSAKPTAKKSPRQGMKKNISSKSNADRGTKSTKEAPQSQSPSSQAVLSAKKSPSPEKPDMMPNMEKSQESIETVLSERHSPDGGDESIVQCAVGILSPGTLEVEPTADQGKKSVGCGNFCFVNKPCISEESDMISTDGSSAVNVQPMAGGDTISIPDVAKVAEFISSDISTPDEQQVGVGVDGKVFPKTKTLENESSEKSVGLIDPTIHGQETSDIEVADRYGIEDVAISQGKIDTAATSTLRDDDHSPIEHKEGQNNKPADNIQVNNQLVECSGSQPAEVTGSDILSSTSAEGSYELCHTGKSLPLASTQETIAETISEFKLDEPVAASEDPTTDTHLQLHQTDAIEEQTISTEPFDTHCDISTGLSASVVARVDPPFSLSDASHSTKDPVPEQELDFDPGHTEQIPGSQESKLPSTDDALADKFELHASQTDGMNADAADVSSDKAEDEHIDEAGAAGGIHSTSSCYESSQPETKSESSYDFSEGIVSRAKLAAKLSEDNPLEARVIASMKAYDEAILGDEKSEDTNQNPLTDDDNMGHSSILPRVVEDLAYLHEAIMANQKTLADTHDSWINQHLEFDEQGRTNENSVDQQNAGPLQPDLNTVVPDSIELDSNVDQREGRKFASPLNASAVPFIPSTMHADPLRSSDELGSQDGLTGYTVHGAAAAVPPVSTNPFSSEMLSDSPSTRVEPEELFLPPVRDQDPCAGQDKSGKAATKKSQARKQASSHVYVDLVYIPNHGDKGSVRSEFFKKIRARYYVLSGSKMSGDQPSTEVLDHFLQCRKLWLSELGTNAGQDDSNVTVIPTHDTPSLKAWYNQNFKELQKYNISVVASGSKVMMQEESIEACKIEF